MTIAPFFGVFISCCSAATINHSPYGVIVTATPNKAVNVNDSKENQIVIYEIISRKGLSDF